MELDFWSWIKSSRRRKRIGNVREDARFGEGVGLRSGAESEADE
jgi:hypothetical protein